MNNGGADQNYYDLLGVEPDAPLTKIQNSYRRLMLKAGHHPDRGGDAWAAAQLNKAYAVLKDPEQRADYDARLELLTRVALGFDVDARSEAFDSVERCAFCNQPHEFGALAGPEDSCATCGSPLAGVDRRRMDSDDVRAVQRLDKRLETVLYTHWQQRRGYKAKIEDISPRGLRLLTRCDVRCGQLVRLSNSVCDAVGEITHSTPRSGRWLTETVAGVAFRTLRLKRAVGGFVSRRA